MMPALNFQKRFIDLLQDRKKRQTIRARREDGRNPKPGDTLFLYVGQRTKGCRKLGEVHCVSVEEITIYETGIVLQGRWLKAQEEREFVIADGFQNETDFYDFFLSKHELPFWGLLIKWE
jgi:hypothetical protein